MSAVGYMPGSTYWNSQAYSNPAPVTSNPQELSRTAGWANTFGQPQGDAPTLRTPDEGVNRGTWIFPEAKRGQSRELSATMWLVLRSLNDAILSTWMPISTPADGALQSHWSRWEFPTQMPDVVPHRGVVRLLKSNRIQGTTSMVRRGIGMFMEHDFMRTELGKKHYMMHLKQINQSVAEGLQFQAIYAMLNSDNWGRKYLSSNGDLSVDMRMERVMEREVDRFAIIQQNSNAWAFLDNIITKENDAYNTGTKLTHYLVDSAVSMYVTTIPTEQWQYYMKGPSGPEMIRKGVEGFAKDPRGNIITETRAFLADEEGAITPLAQKTQIGEVFIAYDDRIGEGNYKDYVSGDRDVGYYDEDDDVMAKLKLRHMLDNCNRFAPDGSLYHFGDRAAMRYNISRFTETQKDLDFLHYKDKSGQRVPVEYFGQIHPFHLGAEDYRDAGRSALNTMTSKYGISKEAAGSLRNLRSLFRAAATFSDITAINAWTAAVIPGGGYGISTHTHPLFGRMPISVSNADGSINLPAAAAVGGMSYPFTHLSYGGLRTFVRMQAEAVAIFGQKSYDIAKEALAVIDMMVPIVSSMYPGSLFLNPLYAPAVTRNPSASDAFFNSIILAGIVTTSAVGPHIRAPNLGAVAAPGAVSAPETALVQLESLFGYPSQYIDSISGVLVGDVAAPGDGGAAFINANPGITLAAVAGGAASALFYGKAAVQHGLNLTTGQFGAGFGTVAARLAAAAVEDAEVLAGAGNADDAQRLSRDYTNFVRFTHLVRCLTVDLAAATTEAGLTKLVSGFMGRAIILNSILFTKTVVSPNDTMLRFRAIFDAVRSAVPALTAIFDNAGDYVWVSAADSFPDSTTLQRMVEGIVAVFDANQTWISDDIGTVQMIRQVLSGLVASVDKKKNEVKESLSRGIAVAAVVAGSPLERLQIFENTIADRHAVYVPTPLTWTNATIKAFVEGILGGQVVPTGLYLLPASVENPTEVMSVREFRERSQQADNLLPIGTFDVGSAGASATGLIGSGIDSIHISSHSSQLVSMGIEHNNTTRVAALGARAQDPAPKSSSIQIETGDEYSTSRMLADTIGAPIGVGSYEQEFSRHEPVDRESEDRRRSGALNLEYSARRKRRSVLDDASLDSGISSLDDERERRKRARLQMNLQAQGHGQPQAMLEKITSSMRGLYSDILSRGIDDLVNIFGILFLGTPVNSRTMEATIEYDLMHPFNYVCARPHASYTGLKIIKGAPEGGKIGMTLVMFPKVEVSDDGTTGVQHTNFTYYADTIVVNSKMINITDNAMIDNYHGGLGSGFYKRESYNPSDDEYGTGSFFIFAIPRRERIEGKWLSISGNYDWVTGSGDMLRDGSGDALTYSTAPFYCGFWGFHQTSYNQPMNLGDANRKYTMDYCAPNNLCAKSTSVHYRGGKAVSFTTQTGHWQQQSVGPGLKKARVGKKPMDNSAYKSVIADLRQITQ